MHTLDEQIAIYKRYHTQPITKITHYIGVPALLLATLMFFNWFGIHFAFRWQISFAWLLSIFLVVYYCFLNIRLGILMAGIMFIVTLIATFLARPVPTQRSFVIFLVLLVIGAIAQIFGHFFEKHKPEFAKSLFNLSLMPLMMTIELLSRSSFIKYFKINSIN